MASKQLRGSLGEGSGQARRRGTGGGRWGGTLTLALEYATFLLQYFYLPRSGALGDENNIIPCNCTSSDQYFVLSDTSFFDTGLLFLSFLSRGTKTWRLVLAWGVVVWS